MPNGGGDDSCVSQCAGHAGKPGDACAARARAIVGAVDFMDAASLRTFPSLPTSRSTTFSSGEAGEKASAADVVLVKTKADAKTPEAQMANL